MHSILLVWFSLFQLNAVPPSPPKVTLGVDVLFDTDAFELVKGKRVGLVTNASGVDGDLVATRVRLATDKRLNLVQLYSPEHGLDGVAPAGKARCVPWYDTNTLWEIWGRFGTASNSVTAY